MRLDPSDTQVAKEFAFLAYETGQPIAARRIFDRLRGTDKTAAEAFENIDRPLREGIARWTEALRANPDDYSGHEELAHLAELRDDNGLAAEHFERAWRLRPDHRALLVDLGRNWKALGRNEDADAALLAASRGAEPRVAEQARELLPARYPYVYEFERALTLDPTNAELRRELAYLHIAMGQDADAEQQLTHILETSPNDAPAAAELARLRSKESGGLKERAASAEAAKTERLPPEQKSSGSASAPSSDSAKEIGMKSLEKGFLPDAVKYLSAAHESNPGDFEVMLKLGWTNNLMKNDREASRWFNLARRSPDSQIAKEASTAYHNLQPELERFRTTLWASPVFSTRWHDLFAYSQIKTEVRVPGIPWLRLYSSVRFVGDTHNAETFAIGWAPQYLSENSVIVGAGVATSTWHGLGGWFEAGESFHLRPAPTDTSTATPDYRGGAFFARGIAPAHWLAETNEDIVYVHTFDNDTLIYTQNRFGHDLPGHALVAQLYWNWNATLDLKREYWANFIETGPGLRFRFRALPRSMMFSVNAMRGSYLITEGNPHPPVFYDLRIGVWYALTR